MEVLKGASGKYLVRLGGIVVTGCVSDLDCPGNSLCALNATWAELPSMCTCNAMYGFIGSACDEAGPQTQFVYGLSGLTLAVACITLIISTFSIYRARLKFNKQTNRQYKVFCTTVMSSLLINQLAAALTISAMASQIRGVSEYGRSPLILEVNGRPEKTVPGQEATVVLYVVTHVATMCTVLLLALSFISISKRAQTLSTEKRSFVRRFSLFYVFISIVVLVPIATRSAFWSTLNIVLFVITFLMGLLYFVAGLNLRRIIHSTNGNNNQSLSDAGRRLYRTSFAVGFTCVAITALGAYSGLGTPRVGTYQPPIYPLPREICFRLSILLLAVAQFLVGQYLYPRKLTSSSNSGSASSKDKKDADAKKGAGSGSANRVEPGSMFMNGDSSAFGGNALSPSTNPSSSVS